MNVKVLHQIRRHICRKERGQRGAEVDILNSQMQQRQQDAHRLLLVPGQHQRQGQVIDAAAKGLRQRHGNLDGTVGIVALTHVHDPGQTADGAQIQIVEAVLAAGQGQHGGIRRCLLDKRGIVIPSGTGAVAAAHQENVF